MPLGRGWDQQRFALALAAANLGPFTFDVGADRLDAPSLTGLEPAPLAALRDAIHPADRAMFEDAMALALQCRQPLAIEFRLVGARGERWHRVNAIPVAGVDGHGQRLVGVAVDVTDRHAAEARAQLLATVVTHATDAIVITEAEPLERPGPRVLFVNPAFERMTGYSRDEIVGQSPRVLQGEATSRAELDRLRTALHAWQPITVELVNYRKDGTPFPVEIALAPVQDERGGYSHWIAVQRDISTRRAADEERRQLERQLLHAQKLESLGVLAGGIAHDFNNLLVSILGNAGLALADLPPGTPAHWAVLDIETAAQRAADLTRQLLAYSGKGRTVVQPLDLGVLVREMGHLLRSVVAKGTQLTFETTPGLPAVLADATQLRQVVMNLILNASEALPHGDGEVTITTRPFDGDTAAIGLRDPLPPGELVALSVRDGGCGMSEATLARLFEPFFTTKPGGRGLGMAAVQGIARSHQGAIAVRSSPGAGTTVTVLLPAHRAPVDAPDAPAPSQLPWGGHGCVLLIDDDAGVRYTTGRMLERLGFRVRNAADGIEGLALADTHAHELALVILDFTMPRLDGAETFRRLRLAHPRLPVLLSSGYADEEVDRSLLAQERTGFLPKPYTPDALALAVRRLVEPAAPLTSRAITSDRG